MLIFKGFISWTTVNVFSGLFLKQGEVSKIDVSFNDKQG